MKNLSPKWSFCKFSLICVCIYSTHCCCHCLELETGRLEFVHTKKNKIYNSFFALLFIDDQQYYSPSLNYGEKNLKNSQLYQSFFFSLFILTNTKFLVQTKRFWHVSKLISKSKEKKIRNVTWQNGLVKK